MCTNKTFNRHINEAMRIKAEINTLKAELEKHTDKIKEELTERGLEAYECGGGKVTYKEVKKSRLDQKKLKADLPDIVAAYTVQGTEMRLTMRQ